MTLLLTCVGSAPWLFRGCHAILVRGPRRHARYMYLDGFGGELVLDALAGQLVPHGVPLACHGGSALSDGRRCGLVDRKGG
jgi:hypothetical protein